MYLSYFRYTGFKRTTRQRLNSDLLGGKIESRNDLKSYIRKDWPTGPNITDHTVSLCSVGGGRVDLMLIAEGCWLFNGHVCTKSSALTYVWFSYQRGLFEQTLSQYLAQHFNLSQRCLIPATFHVRRRPLRPLRVVRLSLLYAEHWCVGHRIAKAAAAAAAFA